MQDLAERVEYVELTCDPAVVHGLLAYAEAAKKGECDHDDDDIPVRRGGLPMALLIIINVRSPGFGPSRTRYRVMV